MKRFYFVGFLVLLCFETLCQISSKYMALEAGSANLDLSWATRLLASPWLYGACFGYLGAFATWMTLLRRAPVGPSFAASHLEIVSVTFFSVWLFQEPLSWMQVVGGVLILAGVLCLAKGEALFGPPLG